MVNGGALKLDLFNMELTEYQQIQFQNKTIFGVICFDVK